MSGICAVWKKNGFARPDELAAAMVGGLAVSGVEQTERIAVPEAAVAVSRRFATQQVYQDENTIVACDADLHNAGELRRLCGLACEPSQPAAPDTRGQIPGCPVPVAAICAALYRRHGAGFVQKLHGSFAVLLWDRQEKKLVAALDRLGFRRLVWYEDDNLLLAASRIGALAVLGEVALDINPRGIANILNFSSNLAPETVFTKIRRMEAGKYFIASAGGTRFETYWDMEYRPDTRAGEREMARELKTVVQNSVEAHCADLRPETVGAFLSGGTDSSTVVGMMSRLAGGPVKAFSIGFDDEEFNELEYARIAAKKFGAEHHTHIVSARDCFEALPGMVRAFDEPFGNSSAIPTYFCARLAAEHGVETLLAGDGGDELFGGNEWYRTEQILDVYQRIPRIMRKGFVEPVLNLFPTETGLVGKARKYVRRSNIPRDRRHMSYQFLCSHDASEVFTDEVGEAMGEYSVLDIPAAHYNRTGAADHLNRVLYTNVKITLADSDLPKVTGMCESAGIRPRFPLLDASVAEFSGRIPADLKVRGFEKRYLFKVAFRELLPPEILTKKKHGFGIPVARWLKTDPRMREMSRDVLLSSGAFAREYFRKGFIDGLLALHEADRSTYYGDILWIFFVIELWLREVREGVTRAIA